MHQPFDRNQPNTWIRRHPKLSRMNERNEIVDEGIIHRYKRQTVRGQLEDARQNASIHTVYGSDGTLSESQPFSNPTYPRRRVTKIALNVL